jgi:hypothetical protein
MSAMLPDADRSTGAPPDGRPDGNDNAATAVPGSDRGGNAESSPLFARWVDIAQVVPPLVIVSKPEPSITSRGVMLVFIVFALILTLGTVVGPFHGMIRQRPRSTTDA